MLLGIVFLSVIILKRVKVYNFMATGVLLTGIIALLSFKISVVTNASGEITGFTSFGNALFFSGLKWIVMLAPLGIVFI